MTVKRVVGFSGGADSQACAGWVLDHFPKDDVILVNTDPGGNEHPITSAFITEYSRTVFPVVVVKPTVRDLGNMGQRGGRAKVRRAEYGDDDEISFADLAYMKGRFPSRKAQFCTEYLKLIPLKRWLAANLLDKGIDFERYVGVRRDESASRANTPESKWDDFFDCTVHYPLAAWTKDQCFAFCAARGEKVNDLYRLGFGRVGCAPCVNSGKDDIREWAARFPEMIDKVRRWEAEVGRTFFPPLLPGGRHGFVDEVVEWARTSHGGKVVSLPFAELDAEAGSCSSLWGLCE